MRFDFGLLQDNTIFALIEYQGDIHYQYSDTGWNTKDNYEKRIANDEEKRQWCIEHNIPLLEIPYWFTDKEIEDSIMALANKGEDEEDKD